MEKGKHNLCAKAIIKTLSYSGVFNYPLSFYQIYTNLISKNYFSGKKIKKELKDLEKKNILKKLDNKYILSNLDSIDWVEREKRTKEKIKENSYIFYYLRKIPWIMMIALTGSSANLNMDENADIDIIFITRKNRLWLTRGIVFLILLVLNKLPKDQGKRRVCPNIFIDERNLSWAKKKRNLYVAQNIMSIQPILDKDNTYLKFVHANKWIKKYYYNLKINLPKDITISKSSKSFILNSIEKLVKNLQFLYMRKKISKEIATDKLIHFNKNDNSKWIIAKYKKILKVTCSTF